MIFGSSWASEAGDYLYGIRDLKVNGCAENVLDGRLQLSLTTPRQDLGSTGIYLQRYDSTVINWVGSESRSGNSWEKNMAMMLDPTVVG